MTDLNESDEQRLGRWERLRQWAKRQQARSLQASAEKHQRRADKMAKKKMRGGRRMRAAQARADADRRKLDRLNDE